MCLLFLVDPTLALSGWPILLSYDFAHATVEDDISGPDIVGSLF